jgi:ABC-2 type transport system permease protein
VSAALAVFRLILRTQVTQGRAAALGTVGAIGILLGFAIGRADTEVPLRAATIFVSGYGLGLLVPLTALVFASAALGDPAEDGTLVYLWHRPIARWRIVAAATLASLCISVPFAVVPTVLAAVATGAGGGLVAGAAVSSLLAAAAYSGVFLCLGLVVRRALAWGLAYVLIWEGFVARSAVGPNRLSILGYARSVLSAVADYDPPRLGASLGVSIVAPLVIAAVGIAATTWSLRRIDVR